jgi:hypothetical protein
MMFANAEYIQPNFIRQLNLFQQFSHPLDIAAAHARR